MKTGVYAIINTVNWKTYVGSAARASGIDRRWVEHRWQLGKGKHHSQRMQYAWDKYGPDAFKFVVIEECDSADCLTREQFWIDKLGAADKKSGYNIRHTAGSNLGTPHSEASKRKMSETMSGRKFSDEHRQALSRAHKEVRHSEQARAVANRRRIPLVATSLSNGEVLHFDSYRGAMRAGFDTKCIKRVLENKVPHHKDYRWALDISANGH